jgi:alpha-D-ribose 1-methylphosphonate 5-triphosphate synthase subunit PhnH
MPASAAQKIRPGFTDPVFNSQAVFRTLLTALSEPGRLCPAPFRDFFAGEPPGPPLLLATALTLCDFQTTFWLSEPLAGLSPYLVFHTGAKPEAKERAGFLFAGGLSELPPLKSLSLGDEMRPDLSATAVAVLEGGGGGRFEASGPGIKGSVVIEGAGLTREFVREREGLAILYPQGVDFVFCAGESLLGLPRTTRLRAL